MSQSLVCQNFSTLSKISPIMMVHDLVRSAIKNPKKAIKTVAKKALPLEYAVAKYAANNPGKAVKAAKTVAKTVAPVPYAVAKFTANNPEKAVKAAKTVAKTAAPIPYAIAKFAVNNPGKALSAAKNICPLLNILI